MARSEHQGMQIALILFGMVTVVLAITTFVFYRSADEQAKVAAAAEKAKQDATTRANNSDAKLEYVMHILGAAPLPKQQVEALTGSFAADAQMKSIMSNFQQHMSTYGAGLPEEERNYALILPKMLMNMRQINKAVLDTQADAKKYQDERDSTQTNEKLRTDEALAKQADAEKSRDDEKAQYLQDRTNLENQQKQDLANYNDQVKQKDMLLAKADVVDKSNKKEITTLEETINRQKKAIIEMRDEPFEVADGQVTWVNQGADLVWINLGMADGLRRQTMFSVYDQADNGVKRTERKGSIEVTRVIDQHLAEARIMADAPSNPILPGDQIFSPAWRPGKRIGFALAGFIDIDGDHRSDRNLVRSLLAASGGQIVYEMHDDGTIEGEMNPTIRYLVRGETPTETSDAKVLAAWSKTIGDANQMGVEMISVDKMLEWVGYRAGEVRSVSLGPNADPAQFKPQAPEGGTSGGAARFRERYPPNKSTFDSKK